MKLFQSIRWRLQLWYGVLLVVVLSGFGFTAFHLERARQLRRIDDGLHERISVLVEALRNAPNRAADRSRPPELHLTPAQTTLFGEPAGYYFAVWMQGKEPLVSSSNLPPSLPKPDSHDGQVRVRGDLREAFLFAAPVQCLLVGRSIATEQADLNTLAAWLATIGGVVLALGLVGGWWLATRAIRPVKAISDTAAKIAAGDLSQRINTTETDSELGQLAGVLNSTFARLDTAFTQQARFTADAAHELRTPVTVMLTHTQNGLAGECLNEEHREAFEAAQRAAQRMRRLIESLLELARLDAGQETLRREECDLAQLATENLELIRPLAQQRGVEIRTDLAAATCHGDTDRLAQVVTNLLANAIEYNQPGGKMVVTTSRENGIARLTVANTGPGISADDLPHIFERFHRADKSRHANGHSGLGLAIAKAIVQAHGGSIAAQSEPGGLTTFTVNLQF